MFLFYPSFMSANRWYLAHFTRLFQAFLSHFVSLFRLFSEFSSLCMEGTVFALQVRKFFHPSGLRHRIIDFPRLLSFPAQVHRENCTRRFKTSAEESSNVFVKLIKVGKIMIKPMITICAYNILHILQGHQFILCLSKLGSF